jgi:hypothetical protein
LVKSFNFSRKEEGGVFFEEGGDFFEECGARALLACYRRDARMWNVECFFEEGGTRKENRLRAEKSG